MDICPACAFCSLKREQCQNIKILNRVHCKTGGFIPYINPQISAQYHAADKVQSVSCWPLRRSLHWVVGKGRKKHNFLYPTPLQTSSPETSEYYGMEVFRGLRVEYWCSRIATHSCEDPRVTLWLKAEYTAFQDGDAPSQVGAQWMLPSLPSSLFPGFHSHLPRSVTQTEFSTPATVCSRATNASS